MLWKWLPPNEDFQDLPSWRELVVATAVSLRRHHADTLIVPMSLIRDAYRVEILGGLGRRGRGGPPRLFGGGRRRASASTRCPRWSPRQPRSESVSPRVGLQPRECRHRRFRPATGWDTDAAFRQALAGRARRRGARCRGRALAQRLTIATVPHVLLLTGPPGSGKTTTARSLAAAAALGAHVESDTFFHFVVGGHVEPWAGISRAEHRRHGRSRRRGGQICRRGYATIVDGLISPKWFMRPLKDALATHGHSAAYAILRPTLATCIARATTRSGREFSNPRSSRSSTTTSLISDSLRVMSLTSRTSISIRWPTP